MNTKTPRIDNFIDHHSLNLILTAIQVERFYSCHILCNTSVIFPPLCSTALDMRLDDKRRQNMSC